MHRPQSPGGLPRILVGLLALGAVSTGTGFFSPAPAVAAAPAAPIWTQTPPPPDAVYTYFVGSADAPAGEDVSATDAATANLVADIMRYLGVTITSETTAVAVAGVKDFQSQLVQTVSQTSSGRVSGFKVIEKYVASRASGITVYLLGRFETAALESERKRLADLFQERMDAVARPEAEGQSLLAAGDALGAARKFIAAAAAASRSGIENSSIKYERNIAAAAEAISKLKVTKLNDQLHASPGAPFPEPFRASLSAGGVPQAQAPFLISYQARQPNGRRTTRTVPGVTGSDGVLAYTPPPPDSVGKATLSIRLDLSADLESLAVPEGKAPASVSGLEDAIATVRASFSYNVASAAASVPTAVLIVDLDESGAPIPGETTMTALLASLVSNGFSATRATLPAGAMVGKDDGEVFAAAAVLRPQATRLIYGTTRVLSVKEDRGQRIVTLGAEVKAVDLESGRVLYASTPQTSAVSSSEAQAVSSGRRQLGQTLLGADLAAKLP